jgi:hypothetical protein
MIATPSEDYPWVLVEENHPAFRDREAAERYLKRKWANLPPGQRNGSFLARVKVYFEPDYDIEVHPTPIDGGHSHYESNEGKEKSVDP